MASKRRIAVPVEEPAQDMKKLGQQGGNAVLEKYGSEHFADLASRRKTFGGGRPKGSGKKQQQSKKRAKR